VGLVWWRWDERGCAGSLARGGIAGVCDCLEGAQESIILVAGICESIAVWKLDTNALTLAFGRHPSRDDSSVFSSTSQLMLFQELFVQVEYHAQR
jgi:hypothetical protein